MNTEGNLLFLLQYNEKKYKQLFDLMYNIYAYNVSGSIKDRKVLLVTEEKENHKSIKS